MRVDDDDARRRGSDGVGERRRARRRRREGGERDRSRGRGGTPERLFVVVWSTHSNVTQCIGKIMHIAGNFVGGIALQRLDPAVGKDLLDDPDVLVPDDQVAGARHDAGAVRDGAAGALRPRVELVDRAEALAVVAERRAGLARDPRDEVGAPRADAAAGGGGAVLRDARPSRSSRAAARPGRPRRRRSASSRCRAAASARRRRTMPAGIAPCSAVAKEAGPAAEATAAARRGRGSAADGRDSRRRRRHERPLDLVDAGEGERERHHSRSSAASWRDLTIWTKRRMQGEAATRPPASHPIVLGAVTTAAATGPAAAPAAPGRASRCPPEPGSGSW